MHILVLFLLSQNLSLWSCTGKLQDFQETLLFDTTALIKKIFFSNHRSYLIHRCYSIPKSNLTHLRADKMAAIFQTMF